MARDRCHLTERPLELAVQSYWLLQPGGGGDFLLRKVGEKLYADPSVKKANPELLTSPLCFHALQDCPDS